MTTDQIVQKRIRWARPDSITARRHKNRINRIIEANQSEFPKVRYPEQIRLSHLKWIKSTYYANIAIGEVTQINWNESAKILVRALHQQDNWYYPLFGIHPNVDVGRKLGVSIVRSAKYNRRKLF